jgi:hypothetical protein
MIDPQRIAKSTWSGLFSMVPTVLAKDRHDISRVEAAEGTFTTIDFPDATFTAALDVNSAGKIVGECVSARDGSDHGFLRNRHGEFITIDFPGANLTRTAGINSRGGNYGDSLPNDYHGPWSQCDFATGSVNCHHIPRE